MKTKTYRKYGIDLSVEIIDDQVSYMQELIFSECTLVEDGMFKCSPVPEVLEIMMKHIPLNEAIEPEVLSTIMLDIAEELALWILKLAEKDLDPRLVGLFAYDFIFQSLQSLFEVQLYDDETDVSHKLNTDKPYDNDDPMFV